MATPNLGIVEVAASQNQKETTINDGLAQLDEATQDILDTDITGGGPFTLTAEEFNNNFVQLLSGSPGAGVTVNTPANKRFFAVLNQSGQTVTVQVTGGGGASQNVADTEFKLLYCDGADMFLLT